MGRAGVMDAAALATEHGVADVFVLRRVAPDRFAHLGGLGRGEGWAGVVDLDAGRDPDGARAVATGDVVRVSHPAPERVFGPYWAADAAFVPVDHDRLVVVGGGAAASDAALRALAGAAAEHVVAVEPVKRLADELEVVSAVKEVLAVPAGPVASVMAGLVERVGRALSCELGVLWLRDGDRVAVWEHGAVAPRGDLAAGVRELAADALPAVAQDARVRPLPRPLASGVVRSWLAVPVGDLGVAVLCHTDAAPRGFTLLCQQLGTRAAEAAATVLQASLERERLHADARVDPLTGVGNRTAWDEAAVRTGEPCAVVFCDVDGLKAINDQLGHHAGDELLRGMAEVLRAAVREGDLVARLGGDEFAVLLPHADGFTARAVVERIQGLIAARATTGGLPLQATVAAACAPPQPGPHGALRAADAIVCAQKAARDA